MHTILTVTQVFLSIGLIGLVLIQHGRGADAGAAFGSGASATVFGARGSGSFLSRATGIIAALFFLTSMAMAYYAAKGGKPAGLMDGANGTTIKVTTPAPVKAPLDVPAARQSGVPDVPGVAVKSSVTDVPAVPGAPAGAKVEPPVPAAAVPVAPVTGGGAGPAVVPNPDAVPPAGAPAN